MTPSPTTVYEIDGTPYLYVRTEARGGGGPEHLFVCARKNLVFQRWTSEVPPEAELVLDTDGRRQAEQEKWLRHAAEHEIEILVGLMRKACAMLPQERADALRREYLATLPPKDDE